MFVGMRSSISLLRIYLEIGLSVENEFRTGISETKFVESAGNISGFGCTGKLIKGRDYTNEETRMNNGQISNRRKLKISFLS